MTLEQFAWQWIRPYRIDAILFGSLSSIALALQLFGVYSMAAYAASQRRREIGVRMALGARRQDVLRLMIRSAARVGLVGIAIGGAGAWLLSDTARAIVFGLRDLDFAVLGTVAALTFLLVLAATFIPARRAAGSDPMDALRLD